MKLNYKEMKDKFEISFAYCSYTTPAYIKEQFNTQNSNGFKAEETLEKALDMLKKEIKKQEEKEIQQQDNLKIEFKNLPFFEKLRWQFKNRKYTFDSTAEERKKDFVRQSENKIKNIDIQRIDKSKEYVINTPVFLNPGDKLYVVVTDQNTLDMGMYEATVNYVNYFERKEGVLNLEARLLIASEGKENEFGFGSNTEKEFKSGHTYHHIFNDKDSAINFHNESINGKMKSMEDKIISLTSKPKMK